MICQRCKKQLGTYEGQFIIYKEKNICVCLLCLEEIRQENIKMFNKEK